MSKHEKKACGLHCLQVRDFTVSIAGRTIVHNVALHAHCGELTAVIGRNGAGKTTLMKALVGEIPSTGTMQFSGHGGVPTSQKPRFGYVPQSLAVDKSSPLTVQDMMLCYTSRWPVFMPHRAKTIDALRKQLAVFGAENLLLSRVGDLSGGELQRVLLALAISQKPDVVLLDEPVSGIDNEGLLSFRATIERLLEQDLIVLMISHDLPFVRERADRVILLEEGHVAAAGTPSAVFQDAAFARAFPVEAQKEANR